MSWLLAFIGFSILIVLHEAGHFAAAKAVGMRVEKFSLFFGPMLFKRTRGETTYGIGPIPLGGYVKISGMSPHEELAPEVAHRAYLRQPVWKRVVVIGAGPAVNIVLAFLIMWIYFWASGVGRPTYTVAQTERDSPAAAVLQPGDRILAVDGRTGDYEQLNQQLGTHRCAGSLTAGCRSETAARLTIVRDGRRQVVAVTPFYDPKNKRMRVGFSYTPQVIEQVGPGGAASASVDLMWRFTSVTVSTIAQLFKAEKRKEVSGIVGGYETVRQSFELSFAQAVFLLSVISLSLGLINLFPFLPLDGGHIFWAVAEKVRGRAIPFRVLERAGFVGFALVLMLFYIGLTNDIERLRGEGFGIR